MKVTRDAAVIREELGFSRSSRLVGIVGNIKDWKGQDVVVRAMAKLRTEFPSLGCIIIGGSSPEDHAYRKELERLIEELGLRGVVAITGYRNDVANYINALDIQIHASVYPEPFGRVLLEAMSLAKPVVACAAGGVLEIVLQGVTGLLYEPGRVDALAECVSRLLVEPDFARKLGHNGYLRLVSEFSTTENVKRTERIYEGLIQAG
jgi:glycosyltransferase involved in cell wall biosynthesis